MTAFFKIVQMANMQDDFVELLERMDIDDDDNITCPHCRAQCNNTVRHRLYISHECPICCKDSTVNYSLPCGHVYCFECFVKIGGIIREHFTDSSSAAVATSSSAAVAAGASSPSASSSSASSSSASSPAAVAAGGSSSGGRKWMFPHHLEMSYEKNKGRQLIPALERNKKQTYDRQVKLMTLLTQQKLDNNGLKDILFYIDERNDMPVSFSHMIGRGLQSGFFREMFENHYKIYMGTYLTHTYLSPSHEMYENCRHSSKEQSYYLGKLYKNLRHLDWRDTLSDLIYRYNNNTYKNTSMNMNKSMKYYCMKGRHFVEKSKHWMYINPLYRDKCKDCVDCLGTEPRYLLQG